MGSVSARKLSHVLDNVWTSLAIEVLSASFGLDQRTPLRPARAVDGCLNVVRGVVAPMQGDRPLHRDIDAVLGLLRCGMLTHSAEKVVGALL